MARKRARKDLETLFHEEADSQAAGFFEAEARPTPQRTARVITVPLSQCLPDRFQSRVILPPALKRSFFLGELDCYDTAGQLLAAAEQDPGLAGQVRSLLALGENILELGQIEPATGSWVPGAGGGHLFAIEVGERRFWSLALVAVHQELAEEPVLRVIEESQFSRARQIAENIQREGNTAVDRARAIAGLILLQLERHPEPELEDDLDYFRQVLDIRRLPNGTWPPLERQLQLSRPVLERHLQILSLPGELVYLAKLYAVPEGRLREVIAAPLADQEHLLHLAITEDLTARELAETRAEAAATPGRTRKRGAQASAHKKAASRLRSFVKLARSRAFGQDYETTAAEFSVQAAAAEELIDAAEQLEEQARWLREMYERRQ